jgi:hypothetical protein
MDFMVISSLLKELASRHFPNPPALRREIERIAGSFSEFLEGALRGGGRQFWLTQTAT